MGEPVGVKYGKHRYHTRSLFTDGWSWKTCGLGKKYYTRSLEGSSCVLISGFATVIGLHFFLGVGEFYFNYPAEFWAQIFIMPIGMTFMEAFSPHTLDTIFLYGFGLFVSAYLRIWFGR